MDIEKMDLVTFPFSTYENQYSLWFSCLCIVSFSLFRNKIANFFHYRMLTLLDPNVKKHQIINVWSYNFQINYSDFHSKGLRLLCNSLLESAYFLCHVTKGRALERAAWKPRHWIQWFLSSYQIPPDLWKIITYWVTLEYACELWSSLIWTVFFHNCESFSLLLFLMACVS